MNQWKKYKIGIISDTHGDLDLRVLSAFKGVDHIIHAGDICGVDVLLKLEQIAQVTAVKGNMDFVELSKRLNRTESVQFGKAFVYVLHIENMLDIEPDKKGFNVIVTGHTHIPLIERKKDVLYINPGSVTLPIHQNSPTVAFLHVDAKDIKAEIIRLK